MGINKDIFIITILLGDSHLVGERYEISNHFLKEILKIKKIFKDQKNLLILKSLLTYSFKTFFL